MSKRSFVSEAIAVVVALVLFMGVVVVLTGVTYINNYVTGNRALFDSEANLVFMAILTKDRHGTIEHLKEAEEIYNQLNRDNMQFGGLVFSERTLVNMRYRLGIESLTI